MDNKPYLVIARKYRPQNFDEVMGQNPIATTLKNAISLNRIGHAYLFTGPRGVGKTSMARIFAKALNCRSGPTVNPCGKCQACIEIEGARSLDVLEIDGASNRGIDEIRTLRENVKFAPAAGKFKIYIIDEVHQITPDGFNALLKTLEEPPAHVKFIFATTAAYKVPATILSRCQRFDFRRIPTPLIADTLKEICKKEKIKIDDEAVFEIAKAADGSLRDSQSILDQIAAMSEDTVTKKDVIQSLGVLEEEALFQLMEALAKKDAATALRVADDVLKEGKDPVLFLEKFLEHVRNLLFLHASEKLIDLVDADESYKKNLERQKKDFTKDELFYFFSVIMHTLQTLKRFEKKRVPLEIALIKLAQKAPMRELSEILETLKTPEKKNLTADPAISDSEEKKTVSLDAVWPVLLRTIKSEKISIASYLAEGEPLGLAGRIAKISFPEKHNFHRETLERTENKKLIERHLSGLLEQDVIVEFQTVPDKLETAPAKLDSQTEETLRSAIHIFGGRVVGN